MKKRLLFIFLLLISELLGGNETGCSIAGVLKVSKSSVLENIKERNCTNDVDENISMRAAMRENLMSVHVLHENKEVLIERRVSNSKKSCPPFCIEPIKIKEVITVGELEVLDFINTLKEKKSQLLIDVRESIIYGKATIPGALNLPFFMLKDDSKYQEEILKLLGAELSTHNLNQKWVFKNPQSLLIFGSSVTSNEASGTIKQLLKLGYPSNKLFFYRAGIESWKALGLTIY